MRLSKTGFTLIKSAALSLSMTLGLLGCNLPSPQKTDVDQSASYFVSKMDGKFTNTENHPRISIPVSKSMSLTACLRENNHSRAILNHAYTIKGGSKDINMETDADGCLVWEEDLDFNYLADENYINLKRTLVPHGYMTGNRDVEFIINPWSGKILSSIDSKVKDPIPEAQAKIALFGKSQKAKRSLWLDWVRLNIMQERIANQKGSYTIEVSGTLLFERLDQNRELQLVPASYAQIHGRIQLICNINPADKGPLKVVIAQMDDVKGNVVNGNKIFLNGKFTLSEFCPSTGFLTAGVSIDVPNGPEHLAAFHGLYHAGPVQNMIGNNFSAPDGDFTDRFKANRSYSVDQYLRDNQTWYRNGTKAMANFGSKDRTPISTSTRPGQPDVRPNGNGPENGNGDIPNLLQKFRIEVRQLRPEFYGYPEQNLKTRTVYFRLNACMFLGIDRTAIRSVDFKIHKINGQTQDKTTMDDGCIEWEDSITYNHFAHEGWFDKEVRLVSKTYGFDEKIAVQLNPWIRTDAWFKDLRWLPAADRTARWKKSPSQILLDYYFFDYSTNRYNYSLDEFLNLNHRRQANMSFKPSLYRPTFRDEKGYVSEQLPAGRYLMRYALIDQSVSDFQNIAALKDRIYAVDRSIVNIREDGAVIDQLSFWIHSESVISLGLLNQLVVEVVPLKEGVTLSSSTTGEQLESFVDHDNAIQVLPHVAQFIHRGEGGGLRKLDRFAGQSLILEYEKLNKKSQADIYSIQKRLAKKEAFSAVNHLKLVNLNDEQGSLRVRTDIANALGRLPVYAVHQAREQDPALPIANLRHMVSSGKIDRALAVRLCGYIFRNLWEEKLPGKNHGLVNNTDNDKDIRLYHLQADCVRLFDKSPDEAFDVEFDYIVERPQLEAKQTCQTGETGQQQCFREIVPDRVDPRTFSVSNSFTMSRSYAASMSTGASIAGSGGLSKFVGINGSYGYEIGDNEARAEGNNVTYGVDQAMVLETLRFRVVAPNAERCMMVRLNPVLLDRVESGWSLFGWDFTDKTSIYAQALHPDLTSEERFIARRKGVLFCEGTKMNKEVRFAESYYLLRPNTPMGLVGDERSRATVEGLFASLRGINDMTAFLSQVMNADTIPANFYREFQARKLDTTRLREAFYRGTRAIPGVYVSPVPLK